jgi:hypothetical protein
MRMRSIVLIAAPLFVLIGLVLARVDSTGQTEPSFYLSKDWLPHHGFGDCYRSIWPFEYPYSGDGITLDEARRRVPFEIPLPGYVPGEADVTEVYVSPIATQPGFWQATLVYGNGIYIITHQEETTLSWDRCFADHPDIFRPVEVSGHPGLGADVVQARICVRHSPFEESECRDGPGPSPGLVEWQAGGLAIAIYSYDYPLAELLRVAESMELR